MKKIILTFVFSIVSIVCFAQSAFDKYDGQDGVTSILVNKKMFQMMASVKVDANDKETQQYLNLIKKLDNLKVITTTSSKISADMKSTAEIYNKTAGLEEFMKVNNYLDYVSKGRGPNEPTVKKVSEYFLGFNLKIKQTLFLF